MTNQREPSSPEDMQAALTGGVPMGRWTEGLLFEGINPTPGLMSASNWFPRTETLGPDELRITFMGTVHPARSDEHVDLHRARQWRQVRLRHR